MSKSSKSTKAKKRLRQQLAGVSQPQTANLPSGSNDSLQKSDILSIVALVVSAIVLVISGWIVINSRRAVQSLDTQETPNIISRTIPLNTTGNAENIQAGSIPLQNQAPAPQAADGNLNYLQPQTSISPNQLKQLQ